MDNNDLGALGSVNPNANANVNTHTHCLGIGIGLGQGPGQGQGPESASSLQNFIFSDYSSYSSLCDWAGGIGSSGMTDGTQHNQHIHHYHHPNNAKVVLPPLSLPQYGCFGENETETDNPFSFLPNTAGAAVMDPWNNVQDFVARPLLNGLEDPLWPGARVVATTATPYA